MSKVFGEGIYSAYRQNDVLHVTATGRKPDLQTKVSLEQLPFLIFPPRLGLFFETEGIVSPVVTPFEIEKAFPNYPRKAAVVSITDKNGTHAIDIVERAPQISSLTITNPEEADFVVYQQVGTSHFLIAKSGEIVPAIYFRAFGPDTYAHCQAYIAKHSAAQLAVEIVPDSFKAWIDTQPGEEAHSRFIVMVDAFVEVDWKVSLVPATPQGINPLIKLLKFDIQLPPGPAHSNAIWKQTFRYEETPAGEAYTDVTLEDGGRGFTTKVETVS
ncbi:MAG: hypothetical protein AB1508_13300 [Pseudomonadota bacterium]